MTQHVAHRASDEAHMRRLCLTAEKVDKAAESPGIAGRILRAIKSGGWWTPAEAATKTGDTPNSVGIIFDSMWAVGTVERRHLGSDTHGDLYAYRLREAAAA